MSGIEYMSYIYRELETYGFKRHFVKNYVLPDWWEDSMADNEVNLNLIALTVSKALGFDLRDLLGNKKLTAPQNSAESYLNYCMAKSEKESVWGDR